MSRDKLKIGILGAGGWGTALAILLHSNQHQVTLWEYRQKAAQRLAAERINQEFLPGVVIPEGVIITSDLEQAKTNKDILVIVVPSHVVRSVGTQIGSLREAPETIVVSATKGIENDTLLRMSQVLLETIDGLKAENLVALSGPSHAEEVSRRIPTAVVAASVNLDAAKKVQQAFMNAEFRVYTNPDIIGVELGGALKNIIAIAAGICDGAGFGDNTKAALQPRGLVEMVRLGTKMGADPLTFAGLSGMGDLIVTCMSRHSRNRYVGEQVGKGRPLPEVLSEMVMVAEGVKTTQSAYELSKKYQVEMPITEQVYKILFEGKNPRDAMYELMMRDAKPEHWG
ncbi:MAG: NAD(P)H-dependent glycerol-3-phosphate dehydrogenase [candidate division KSB1 bacterium]|nr:NAD(P)H-dependent glycerol-3-phosphate dehydrogenase [candidate division KSB1 bacterium]